MMRWLSKILTKVVVSCVAVALVFVVYVAPGLPRTVWGWAISAAIGWVLVLPEMVVALCFKVIRYHGDSQTGQAVLLGVRLVSAAALLGGMLWALYAFLGLPVIRAQFR